MYNKAQKVRLAIVFFTYLILLIAVVFRLLDIQILNNEKFVKLADVQHLLKLTLYPQRGLILDSNNKVLALSLKVFSVYAVPRAIQNKEEVADLISKALSLDRDWVLERLRRDKEFIWIKRRLPREEALEIKKLKIPGIDLLAETKRFYPNGILAAHVIGFSGLDEKGLEGLELKYDEYLKGERGRRSLLRDAKQRMMPAFEYEFYPAIDGYDLILTIDQGIQHIVESELDAAMAINKAKSGSIVVMNPENGDILALANRPCFDLNDLKSANEVNRRNCAITDYYEPGSTFKIIAASAALEEGIVKLDDKFFCENGAYRVASHILHDHRPHGDLTFVEVIEKSSNIGTVKIAQKLGPELLHAYVKKFGFGQLTSIDLPGETPGYFRPLSAWSKLSISAIPIGHEIGVSILQMVRAMAVIANGGDLVSPHLVKKIVDNHGETIREYDYSNKKKVISENTALLMRQILGGVVERGTGKSAQIKGYTSGGKTGTAQKITPEGTYSHNKFVASFIGFAPVEDPQVVIAVVFDEPHPFYYGGTVAAPVFGKIAEKILKYMDIQAQPPVPAK